MSGKLHLTLRSRQHYVLARTYDGTILFELQLRNKVYLHIITSFAYQGKQLNEIYSVPWEDDGILPFIFSILCILREKNLNCLKIFPKCKEKGSFHNPK